jgi:MSHA biogenesis protein MshJ
MTGARLPILEWIDGHGVKERAVLLVTVVLVLSWVSNVIVIGPLRARQAQGALEVVALRAEVEVLELESERVGTKLAFDLNEPLRIREDRLERELAALNSRVVERTQALIPPDEMARVLKKLLPQGRDPRLVRVTSLPAEPLVEAEGEEQLPDAPGHVYRHGVEVELRGSYLSTLRYLEAVEQLPWRLFWEGLEYEVLEYPEARIVLTVRTLSLREGWIGV